METRIPTRLQEVAARMAKVGKTDYKTIRRPNWKEYTLVKYEDKRVVSREKIRIDESKYFPSDEDFFWEPKEEKEVRKVA